MPWGNKSVEELRGNFLFQVKQIGNISKACREIGITRKTGYKWLKRNANGESLSDRSRKPKQIANKTEIEVEALILSVRDDNPSWGGKMIHDYLAKKGKYRLPSPRTCCNILKRNGCILPEESLKHQPYQRFVREHCNDLWQTDFKGDFLLLDGSRCYPLSILDDCSRFAIMIDCKPDTKGVKDSFQKAFYCYGKPNSVLSDNGGQFRGLHGGYTQFERWLMEHDVLPIHGRPWHPQTQGKVERFHKTMKYEFLRHKQFCNLEDIKKQMEQWRIKYNEERPHLALNSQSPAEIYTSSKREYSEKVLEYYYEGYTRKVNKWGYIRFSDWQIYLSETMANTILEITENASLDLFDVYFRNFKIAQIDAHDGKLVNRKISKRR